MSETINNNIKKAISFTVLLFLIALVTGLIFESQIISFSESLLNNVNVPTLGLFVALNDLIVSPVPPDVLLLVLSKSDGIKDFLPLVSFLGLCSSLGGTAAWLVAKRFGNPSWLGNKFQNYILRYHDSVNQYGKWAVGLAAMTPLPFSVVCWIAGFVKVDFPHFFLMALLRVPRFLLYFYILVFSSDISSWVKTFI